MTETRHLDNRFCLALCVVAVLAACGSNGGSEDAQTEGTDGDDTTPVTCGTTSPETLAACVDGSSYQTQLEFISGERPPVKKGRRANVFSDKKFRRTPPRA